MAIRKSPKAQAALVALGFVGLLGIPLLAAGISDEVARLLSEGWPMYVLFVVLVAGASTLVFVGPRAAAMAVLALLLVGGFLFFYYLPWLVLPLVALLAASFFAPRTFQRRRRPVTST